VHQPQPAEARLARTRAADVRQHQPTGIPHDHPFDLALAGEQHAQLAVELGGELGEVPGQLGADQLVGPDSATVGRFQPVNLILLQAERVAE
jgi:hypothetical protein